MGARALDAADVSRHLVALLGEKMAAGGMNRSTIEVEAPISHNRLAVVMRGERPMTVEELVRICDVLGLKASTVLKEVEQRLGRGRVVRGPWGDVPDWADAIAARDVDE